MGSDIWTADEAVKATGGRSGASWRAAGVSIDTRTLQKGDLFIAIKGDAADGHDYVAQAFQKGAAAAIVSRVPDNVDKNAPLLVVADTLVAMQDLGRAARARTAAKIIGITGSVGKTGTKEMLAAAFGVLGQTHASKASHNNHWGVPFSLSSLHAGADYAIFEMGMNHAGEISPLTRMVRPHVAIITTIAAVHIENFENMQGIADAKAEIFEGVEKGGSVILNRDNEWFEHLKNKAEGIGLRVLSFGAHEEADCRLVECLEAANGTRLKADVMGEEIALTLMIPGRHIAQNALSVLLAVKVLGGDLKKAAAGLAKLQPISGRGKREMLDYGDPKNPVTLIDESYNASPEAMKAAFKVLALIDPGRGGRRIAVLGDMLELGKDAPRLHADLSLPLSAAGVQLVYTCGPLMKNLYDNLPQDRQGAHKKDSVELAKIVPAVLTPGDVVMVKGSHGSRMGVVVEALRSLSGKMKAKTESNHNAV